jgi:hypothetical protein
MESFLSAPIINCFKFYWSTFQKEGGNKNLYDEKKQNIAQEDNPMPL